VRLWARPRSRTARLQLPTKSFHIFKSNCCNDCIAIAVSLLCRLWVRPRSRTARLQLPHQVPAATAALLLSLYCCCASGGSGQGAGPHDCHCQIKCLLQQLYCHCCIASMQVVGQAKEQDNMIATVKSRACCNSCTAVVVVLQQLYCH
jgi:hypothetical protein